MRQDKTPPKDLGKTTTEDFKDLNVKDTKAWQVSAEADRALAALKRSVAHGSSSSIRESGKTTIPKEGGPDSQRDGG